MIIIPQSLLDEFCAGHIGRVQRLNSICSGRQTAQLIRLTPSDDRLRTACTKFPNYVESRYSSHGLTRLELMALAVRAQFVAADAIRRVSDRNMAGDMEHCLDCPPRPEP